MGKKSRKGSTRVAMPFTAAVGENDGSVIAKQNLRVLKTPEPQRRLQGRGVACAADKFPVGACLCARPKAIVFCHACGYFRPGRKRIQCPQHPTVHFLYDVETCEKCHTSFYLDEYNM